MSNGSKSPQDQLEYLWDAYKYRHGLCWQAVYKIIASVVALAVIPYVKQDFVSLLKCWILVPPGLGVAVAIFGLCFVRNELRLFNQVVNAHKVLRQTVFEVYINKKQFAFDDDRMSRWFKKTGPFDIFVYSIIVIVIILSSLNVWFMYCRWIPMKVGEVEWFCTIQT